jgi:hypothetical protein
MKRILIPTLSLLLLAGCATQGTRMDSEKLDQLKPGISTIADAENLLGKPQSVARHPDGTTTLGYQFSSVQTDGKSMIPVEYTGLNFDKTGHFLNSTSFQHN